MLIVELVGYLGSVLVGISLMMKKILKLRIINLVGAIVFVIYSSIVGAYPVAVLNAFICVINIAQLWKLTHNEDSFEMIFVDQDSEFLQRFIQKNQEEINNLFPNFNLDNLPRCTCVFILRNLTAVGVFIYHVEEQNAKIYLDYVVPEYRDFKNARFLFSRPQKVFRGFNVENLTAYSEVESHDEYLRKVGFVERNDMPNTFVKKI